MTQCVISENASDSEIVDAVWDWLTLLAHGRYRDACEWFAEDSRFRWQPRELERRIKRFFGGWRARPPLLPPAALRSRVEIYRFSEIEAGQFVERNALPTAPRAHIGFFVPVRGDLGIWTTMFLRPPTPAGTHDGLVFDFEIFHL